MGAMKTCVGLNAGDRCYQHEYLPHEIPVSFTRGMKQLHRVAALKIFCDRRGMEVEIYWNLSFDCISDMVYL